MPDERDTDKSVSESTQTARPSQPILLQLVVLFCVTIAAQLVSLAYGRINVNERFASIVLPSLVFLSIITIPSIWLGIALGRQIGLGTPLLAELLSRKQGWIRKAGRDASLACILGVVVGGLLLLIRQLSAPYLPPEIPAYGHRGVLGGLAVSFGAAVAEEVWFRLGLMTLMVWCVARLLKEQKPRPFIVWTIIVLTSVSFGLAHLPQLISYGAGSPFAIGGTVIGNSVVGTLYGWCYWRRSLFAAMIAHFSVDIVIHVLPAFAQ